MHSLGSKDPSSWADAIIAKRDDRLQVGAYLSDSSALPFRVRCLAVRLAAVADAANFDSFLSGVDEEEPIVADPEAQLFPFALKRPNISDAGFSEAMKSVQDAHGGALVEAAYVGPRLVGPGDPLYAGSL